MKFLFVGDIVGKPGRDVVRSATAAFVADRHVDLVVANAENCAGGSGLTPSIYRQLMAAGVDAITLGDHIYRRREIRGILESKPNIVKPANYPESAPGQRFMVLTTRNGIRVAVVCLLGQLFMKNVDSPFRAADQVLKELPDDVRVILVDFHAEATSEKQLLGRYLDGRVTAVLGTHTHVPTADETVLPGGTAFQCDVGMTGPYHSIIGRRIDRVMETTLSCYPTQFDVAHDDVRLAGALVEVDPATGRALRIERICLHHDQFLPPQRPESETRVP